MKYYDEESSIENIIDNTMSKIKTLMETNTIVGETIVTADGTTIIPISKVSVGFVVGGGEYSDMSSRRVSKHYPMAGGSGGGMTISPVGFIVHNSNGVSYIDVEDKTTYQTFLNLFNKVIDALGEKKEE